MESALDVLSRAATMVQDNANEARLSAKELPTTKWRRDRRQRTTEYQTQHNAGSNVTTNSPPDSPKSPIASSTLHTLPASPHLSIVLRPLCESTNHRPTMSPIGIVGGSSGGVGLHATSSNNFNHNSNSAMDSPIDMSVSSSTLKHQRASPPPPYREPLPGSSYASTLARPSVITQAPPKRDSLDSTLISNRENDNRSTESVSMCETVIDEHFRRSLGADYVALFSKKSPTPNSTTSTTPSPQPSMVGPPLPDQPMHAHQTSPYHHAPQHAAALLAHHSALPLISPKPTTVLHAAASISSDAEQPHALVTAKTSTLPPPQDEPLSLHRSSSPQSPQSSATPPIAAAGVLYARSSPLPNLVETLSSSNKTQTPRHSPMVSNTPPPPPPVYGRRTATASTTTTSNTSSTAVAAATTVTMPAIMRIKAEPGLAAATNTPPASPTSSSNASIFTNSSEVLASVDDHFAKALGDTWKKLQESKELRK